MKRLTFFLIVFINCNYLFAQQNITLQDCYALVETNYPLIKQQELLKQQNKLDIDAINATTLPQFNLEAQATYQSEVTQIPIPNSGVEPLNKDQYRATLSLNQLIYGGGIINASKNAKGAQLKTRQQQIVVDLHKIKTQINQLYFSILLNQEVFNLLNAKKAQLQSKLKEVQSGIKYGAILPASDQVLEAELLKIDQQFTELNSSKSTLLESLSLIIGQSIETSSTFEQPLITTSVNTEINRPELHLFDYKKEDISNSETLITKQNAPKLNGFATGGYGNPGLNMLDNSFQPFYTVGLKLNWNVFDWNSNKKQREALAVNKDIIDTNVEVFKLNTNIELNQQEKEINKIEDFIKTDNAIIKLRKNVLETSNSQLLNGVITSSAYMIEFTNLLEAENTQLQHQIQLQLAKANYNTIKGY